MNRNACLSPTIWVCISWHFDWSSLLYSCPATSSFRHILLPVGWRNCVAPNMYCNHCFDDFVAGQSQIRVSGETARKGGILFGCLDYCWKLMFWNRILFMVVSFVCDCLPHTHAITKSLSGISASPIYNAFNYTRIINV